MHFGLNRLEDLPSIEEFDQLLGTLNSGGVPLFGDAVVIPPGDPDIATTVSPNESEGE